MKIVFDYDVSVPDGQTTRLVPAGSPVEVPDHQGEAQVAAGVASLYVEDAPEVAAKAEPVETKKK